VEKSCSRFRSDKNRRRGTAGRCGEMPSKKERLSTAKDRESQGSTNKGGLRKRNRFKKDGVGLGTSTTRTNEALMQSRKERGGVSANRFRERVDYGELKNR